MSTPNTMPGTRKRGAGRVSGKTDGLIRQYDLRKPPVAAAYTLMMIVAALAVALSVAPLIWTILGGFKTMQEFSRGVKTVGADGKNKWVMAFLPVSFSLDGYIETWRQTKFMRNYLNSLYAVLGCCASALLFNGLMAYGLSRLKPRGWRVADALVTGSLLLPGMINIVPLFINLTRLGLTRSFIPLWLGVGASAFTIILFKNFYDAMPSSLFEAARLDGCSNLQMFFRIVMPLSMPINMVVLIFTVNGAWSDFLLPYLLLNNSPSATVMVRLFEFRVATAGVTAIEVLRATVFSILPPIALFIIFQRQITSNVMASGMKG
ncbi:MAG: carbohydrate ABC transporter permease [Oscillospiraceae bacterium]|jgi:multiple sugar transport system permease protein|nr:carbohydrate ABC transporter permease [Oscillospiraceae bacterium]